VDGEEERREEGWYARLGTVTCQTHHLQLHLVVVNQPFQIQTQRCEMADWSTQYLAALDARDRRENTHKSCIDACTSPPTDLYIDQITDNTQTLVSPTVRASLAPPEPLVQPPPTFQIKQLPT
jgi:hypothetical protein